MPNAYAYRLRAVSGTGAPLSIPRARGVDDHGLMYAGETGIKNNDPSYRGEKLARGVVDQAVGTASSAHGGARKFWADNWDAQLKAIDPNYRLEFGWDEQVEETILANKDERLPQNQQTDQTITNSGKGLAMNMEDAMIRQYKGQYGEWPPLNSADSPGLRDRDRKTKHDVSTDTKDVQ